MKLETLKTISESILLFKYFYVMKNVPLETLLCSGIAIARVISVQIYWINQALNLQQKQFQESVLSH